MAYSHREGDTIYDASNNVLGVWRNGQIAKNQPAGPNLTNPTGFTGSAVSGGIPGYTPNNGGFATAGTTADKAPQSQLQVAVQQGANSDATKGMYNGGAQGRAPAAAPALPVVTTPKVTNPIQMTAPSAPGTDYDARRLAIAEQRNSALMRAIEGIEGMKNPYDPSGADFARIRGAAMGDAVGQYNQADALASGRIGGASGMRAAGSDARSRDLRASMAGVEGDLLTRGADWNMRRNSALLNALGGSSLDGVMGDLSRESYTRDRDAKADQLARDGKWGEVAANLIAEYGDDALAMAGKYGPQVVDAILKYAGG